MPINELAQLSALILETGRRIRAAGKTKGISPHTALQVEVLHFVKEAGAPTMRDIAEHFHITPPSATVLINRLVKDKALTRTTNKTDRRITHLKITPSGDKALKIGSQHISETIQSIFKRLPTEDRSTLIRIINNLSDTYHD